MSNLSEDKIMDIIKGKLLMIERMLKQDDEEGHTSAYEMQFEDFEAIQGLLDLYNKEKEKNEVLESKLIGVQILVAGNKDRYICKDKIEKKIEELESKYKDEVKTAKDYDTNQFVVDCVAVLEELLEE